MINQLGAHAQPEREKFAPREWKTEAKDDQLVDVSVFQTLTGVRAARTASYIKASEAELASATRTGATNLGSQPGTAETPMDSKWRHSVT